MTGYILPLSSSVINAFENTDEATNISNLHQNIFASYNLRWRQNILWVAPHASSEITFPVSVHQLVNRLQHSPVRCVCIDSSIGESHLNIWQDACTKAGKRLHIRTPKDKKTAVKTVRRWMGHQSLKRLASYLGGMTTAHV